jgi:hypothetical protein
MRRTGTLGVEGLPGILQIASDELIFHPRDAAQAAAFAARAGAVKINDDAAWKGGNSFRGFLENTRKEALANVTDEALRGELNQLRRSASQRTRPEPTPNSEGQSVLPATPEAAPQAGPAAAPLAPPTP